MISNLAIKKVAEFQRRFLSVRNLSSTINIEKLEKESASEVDGKKKTPSISYCFINILGFCNGFFFRNFVGSILLIF